MQPGIDNSCANSGCHASADGYGGDLSLDSGSASVLANRKALLEILTSSFSDDGGELYKKISNITAHSGGDKSGDISEAQIKAWLEAEAGCS
jgi:hypothetical protein